MSLVLIPMPVLFPAIRVCVMARHNAGSGTRYAGYFVGNIYASALQMPSDEKLKKEIRPYHSALAALSVINVYRYRYDRASFPEMNLPQGEQIGVLADEVEAAFPELVLTAINPALEIDEETAKSKFGEGNFVLNEEGMVKIGEDVEFKSVNYPGLIPVMLESIKELQKMIEKQQEEIEELRMEIKSGKKH